MSLSRAGLAGSVVALLASVLAGCGAAATHPVSQAAADTAARQPVGVSHPAAQREATTATSDRATSHSSGSSSAGGMQHVTRTGGAAAADATTSRTSTHDAGLRGTDPYVWKLRASVSPTCVKAGGTATVTVRTAANAALAYVAVYAGEKSGAPKPFGYGYGGNDDGFANDAGTWANTFQIHADAPRGPARVTVVAGSHQSRKQVDVPFTVVDPVTGHC